MAISHQVQIQDFIGENEIVSLLASHSGGGKNKRLESVIYISVNESLNVETAISFRVKNNNTDFIVTNDLKEAISIYNNF